MTAVTTPPPGGGEFVDGPAAPMPGAAPAPVVVRRRRRLRRAGTPRRNRRTSAPGFVAVCLLPALVLFALFIVWPTISVFKMSLYSSSGFSPVQTWVGLQNFVDLFHDTRFVQAFENTITLLVVVTVVTLAMAVVLAALMTRQKLVGRNVFRFVLYVPNILSIVVIAAIFSAVYDQRNGLINGTLSALSLDGLRQVWLGNQGIVLYSVGAAMVWQSLGYYMVMYMASMASIPEELYEASAIDGAGHLRQFSAITLPLIWQNMRSTLTFFVMSAINLSFVLVQAMTGGGPDGSSEVLLSYMYKQAFTNSSYGYGMAIGVVVFAFSFLVSLLVNQATKRDVIQF